VAIEVAATSLLEHVAETGFRSSVIATYSCYFPFYEDVVLRRLMAAGCTHNVLMVDATRCAEAFASADLRPHRAGRDYTLIPVKVGGAFHPKMFLRFGKSKGSLLVGSHNMTLSGFGLNDEVTNIFRVEGAGVRSGGGPLRQAFEYLAGFVPAGLPDVVESYEGLKLGIPWLDGPLGAGDPARLLLTSSSTGPDLWSQIAPLVPSDVATAFICGPFFDPALALVRRIQRDMRPRELVIGIDPASVEIDPAEAASLANVRWVNVAGVPPIPQRREGSSHYLHAKLFWFAGKKAELLVAGSANPSVAAFFAPATGRNAEAVVADSRSGVGDEIGIDALVGAPPITAADWKAVAARRASKPTTGTEPSRRILVATPTPNGFRTHDALPLGLAVRGVGDGGADLGEAVVQEPTALEAPDAVRDGARYLEGEAAGEHVLVLVHRTEDIAKNIGGDTRKALRQALGALEEDPSQLEALLKLTEKVIFDSDDVVRTTPLRPTSGSAEAKGTAPSPASLALDAAGRKSARRKRSLASGDIVVLLDALMRRLGEGLPANAAPRPRNDQDEIGADEEDGGELAREAPDFEVLAKACRGKVRRLIKRMEGQFGLATASDRARRGIVQLAAVLGVVRTLRLVGQRPEWRRAQLALVDPDDEWRLFEAAVLAVAWGDDALAPRAIAEAGGEWFDELSMVTGLLAWLAWDVEIDAEEASKRAGLQGVEDESWYSVQLLAALGPWLAGDESAATALEESVARTPRHRVDADRWLRIHSALAYAYAQVASTPDQHGQTGRHPRPGDLVVLSERESPRVRVVLDVRPGSDERKVVFFDPGATNEERAFLASRVRTLPWTPASESAAV
jgi:hypothetical protein